MSRTSIPPQMVMTVLERDNHRCVIRGPHCTYSATVADHRANRGSGGSRVLNNPAVLIAACALDNSWKETVNREQRADLIARGIRVEKAATNEATLLRAVTTPVTYPDGSVWLLLEDGTREPADRSAAP